MTDATPPVGPSPGVHDGRVVFRARRPGALVYPLAAFTELAGLVFLLAGDTSFGIVACAAPLIALLSTAVILRPTLEVTRDGLVQRQYPFSTLTRWDVIESLGLVRAGNRVVLAYRLVPGIPPPRRQPAAALLRAAAQPYDGGYFADSLRGDPAGILAVIEEYRREPSRRERLPIARR